MKRIALLLPTALVAALMGWGATAQATQSTSMRLSNGTTNTCYVTSAAPKMTSVSTKATTASATVWCTQAATITVTISVVEMDGTTEDRTTQLAERTFSVTVKATTNSKLPQTVTVTTPSFTCVSTESDNEELATKARVSLSPSAVSAVDRTAPSNNQYNC
mgnify:CR=1 FL=1